jgi:hypothetical protein
LSKGEDFEGGIAATAQEDADGHQEREADLEHESTLSIRRHRSIVRVSVVADLYHFRLNAASRDPLNPLAPPSRRLEGIRKILCLVHNLTVAELHNAHCV